MDQRVTVLMVSANPKGTAPIRLDEERREVEAGLMERSRLRDQFRLITKVATRSRDVQRAMLDYEPQVVHFSGHGSGDQGLLLEDEAGQVKLVSADALAALFKLYCDRLQYVVLNACYSTVQAEAIAQHIPYVIGMSDALSERAAIEFAVAFYDALGAGRDLKFAYKNACVAIQLAGISQAHIPVLHTKNLSVSQPKVNIRSSLHSVAHSVIEVQQPVKPSSIVPQKLASSPKKSETKVQFSFESEDDLSSTQFGQNYYAKLRDLLRDKNWRAADHETAKYMCEVMHRQDFWLRRDDLERFPCEDLNIIDKLWVKYSNGHFGFSVQKQIWQAFGSPKEKSSKDWRRFLEKLEWNTTHRTFDLTAPKGHLPRIVASRKATRFAFFAFLAARLTKCKI